MKKYFILVLSIFLYSISFNSCSEDELQLYPPYQDDINSIDTEDKMQQFLNGAYISSSSVNAFGTQILLFGDVLSDHLFVSNSNSSYLTSYNLNYSSTQNEFNMYGSLYDVIMKCNMVIENDKVPENENVKRIKAEARILRGFCYFTLVNFYSPTPSSGINQEYGVPLVLGKYDVTIQPARATVAEVYEQIISDLKYGVSNATVTPSSKVILSQTAAKLLLSRVYLTRRASGDAALALQYANEVINNSPAEFAPVSSANYANYFLATDNSVSENQPETIWELDINSNTIRANGIGSNISLPCYYNRIDSRKCMLFTSTFYDSFPHSTNGLTSTDVRRGASNNGLLTVTNVPNTDNPKGVWTNKYPRVTQEGNYARNIKILRFSEAILNRIEALYLTNQTTLALNELNQFAASRGGYTYTGADLLNDILTERDKEFYGEGMRFFDLKRYGLPIIKNSNCVMNCNVPGNDKLFVLPMSQAALNQNQNLKQYPGYN